MNREQTWDVFVSCAAPDRHLANAVASQLVSAGLTVFTDVGAEAGTSLWDRLRDVLVEARAVVVLWTQNSQRSANIALELGMATAWAKPVYLLLEGVSAAELPDFTKSYVVLEKRPVEQLVQDIRQDLKPLSDDQLETLTKVYRRFGEPTDRLVSNPKALDEFARTYRQSTGSNIAGERLTQELLRLRKQGRLPRLGKKERAAI